MKAAALLEAELVTVWNWAEVKVRLLDAIT